jgi:hypothetical protein
MKYLSISIKTILFFALTAAFLYACKKEFDAPPGPQDPDLMATHTIARLKSIHKTSGALDVIDTAAVISGVVIANDKSGNLYKQIYIQDATGAIQLMLDASGLYNSFPVGRKVFVKCKDLCLSDDNGMIRLGIKAVVSGSPSIQAIASNLIGQFVIGGSINNTYKITTISDVTTLNTTMQDSLLGTLIELDGYEFLIKNTTYADTSAYKDDRSLRIRLGCNTSKDIIIRTSGFANFSGVRVPSGNGKITALYTVFGSTKQLVLRDTVDLKFTGAPCIYFYEDFNDYISSNNSQLSIPEWKNINQAGDVFYTISSISNSRDLFAKISAFNSIDLSTKNISSWLISPAINLPTGITPKYNFNCSRRYPVGTFNAYLSTDYDGVNLTTASWVLLQTVPPGSSASFTPFTTFGPFDLSSYAGKKIHIAFRYEAPAGTSKFDVATYQVDKINISEQ